MWVSHKWSQRSSFSFKRTANRNISPSGYTDGSITKDQSGWDFTVKQGATTITEDSAIYKVLTSSLTMEVEAFTHALWWIVSEVTDGQYMLLSSQIQWACYKMWKVEWEAQTSIYVSAGHPPVDAKPRTSHHWLPAQERGLERESAQQRKCSTIFLERMREGHRQADEHWNCFKGHIAKTTERWDGVNNYGLFWVHEYHLEWNWPDISSTKQLISH